MKLKNISTGKPYSMTRAEYDSLGKNKRLFTVIDETDEAEAQEQPIVNTLTKNKAKSEAPTELSDTHTTTTKKKPQTKK